MRNLLIIIAVMFIASCATTSINKKSTSKSSQQNYVANKVVFDDKCANDSAIVKEEALGAIAVAAVPLIINLASKAYDYYVEYLENYDKKLTSSITGRGSGEFYVSNNDIISPGIGCVTFVSGKFSDKVSEEYIYQDVKNEAYKDRLRNLNLVEKPNIYIEFSLKYNEASSAFYAVPVYLEYNKYASEKIGKNNVKDLAVTIQFDSVGIQNNKQATSTFATFDFVFNKQEVGTKITQEQFKHIGSKPMPLPGGIDRDKIVAVNGKNVVKGKVVDTVPVSATINVVETENAPDLYGVIAKALKESKKDVFDELSTTIKDAVAKGVKESKK